jgi:hypothetical protein
LLTAADRVGFDDCESAFERQDKAPRSEEVKKNPRRSATKSCHGFQRLVNIAPTTLNRFDSPPQTGTARKPSSLLISSHNLHSVQEPIATCNAQPSQIVQDLEISESHAKHPALAGTNPERRQDPYRS